MDPFFTTKRDKGGTGLGLSVSYNIVKSHGGLLVLTSEPNKGTRAKVTLPVVPPHAGSPEQTVR
jgi:signal transduction histidine kinase